MTEASQRNKPFSYFHLFLSAYSFVVLGFLLIGSRWKCGEPLLRWTNRAYDPTLTIRKHLDTEQTRVSLDLNSPCAGISSGRVGGKLVTLMRSSSAEHGQLWWNRISDSGCVAVQTGLLLLLKVVSRGVLKRRRWRSGGVTQGASKSPICWNKFLINHSVCWTLFLVA